MHEISLGRSVIRIVEEEAVKQAFSKVVVLRLEVGALSPVEPEALAFCFEAVAKGSPAEGARLDIIRTPGLAWCKTCATTVPLKARYDPCPHCGGHQLRIEAGAELRIKDMEVE
ncbi:MAG: hydrogenase maturation nickel metallochaperone HypA [Alphaproteobacteria bacterium RIFOXYD12_FULL_60_8]|nr:MAG: hydrogenase maturation nickel metallochaperone HypA [Alphaproteobacteria bacterium RIFOXYD12_FULL_60_8]